MGRTAAGDSMNVKKNNQGKTQSHTSAQGDDFQWDSYLRRTGSSSAPVECFRQSKIPPTNEFKVGMKLEAHDPRNMTSICIATIIGVTGARLRLRLDGSDDKNDFWRLVDSADIQPIGTCEQQGDLLQPPLGFILLMDLLPVIHMPPYLTACIHQEYMTSALQFWYQGSQVLPETEDCPQNAIKPAGYKMSTLSWPMFLLRTLDGSDMAPATFFKEEPPMPPLNNFKVGMKLEAVDKKNPDMICPATIGDVRGDEVHITFDGWSGAFDYWCKYYCRDIFPVGWCRLAGDVLQPPGAYATTKSRATRQSSLYKPTLRSMQSAKKTAVALPPPKTKKSGRAKPPGRPPVPKKESTAKNVTPKQKVPEKEKSIPVMCSTSSTSVKMLTRGRGVEYKEPSPGSSKIMMSTVCVYINKHGDCGPYLDQNKIKQLPDHFGPGPVNVVLRRTVQACVDCGLDSKTVFGFLKADNRGGEVITAFFDGETHSIQLPPVNSASFALRFLENLCHSLHCDNLLSSQPFSACRGNILSTTEDDKNKPVEEDVTEKQTTKRPSEQPLSDVAPLSPKLPKIEMHASQEELLSSEGNIMLKEEKLPEESKDSPLIPENTLNPAGGDPISTDTTVSKNFSEGVPVSLSSALVDTSSTQSIPHEFQMQKNSEAPSYIAVPDPSVLKQGFSKDPSTWCVDEVIQFMKHKDPQISGPLADLFRQHEIDGKALLLLKSDVVMKYMGLKLGPALKLCYHIEKLKEGKPSFKNI